MQQFTRGELRFDVTDSGPADAEAIVLLHGWPQDRHAFDPVIPLLTAAGYRALAFDQRGYSPGAQPASTSSYAMSELVADVLAAARRGRGEPGPPRRPRLGGRGGLGRGASAPPTGSRR